MSQRSRTEGVGEMSKDLQKVTPDRKEEITPHDPTEDGAEIRSLATELGRAYQREVAFYREQMKLSSEEADLRALGLDKLAGTANPDLDRIGETPPDYLHWSDLVRLGKSNPEEFMAVWEDLKANALDELLSGHRIAKALEWNGTPWDRARFLAIRKSLQQPRGIDSILVSMVAEAYSTWLELSEQHQMLLSTDGKLKRGDVAKEGRWGVPHDLINDAIKRVEQRVERAHKRLLSAIKMLEEHRRLASTVIVGHAAQLNVAQHQINVIPSPDGAPPADEDFPKSLGDEP